MTALSSTLYFCPTKAYDTLLHNTILLPCTITVTILYASPIYQPKYTILNILRFINLKFNLDSKTLTFSFILFIVTLIVLIYRIYYLSGEVNFNYYFFILLIFVLRIFSLNFRNNILLILVSWDLLGISRFFLVLFYNNWDRIRGSINTVLTNRLGDYFLFIFFRRIFFSRIFFTSSIYINFLIIFFLIITSFTKRAQFPFRGWLPKAMRAPTPVSSLVHRRTLVTAGLILLFNFKFIILFYKFSSIILNIGCLTIIFSRLTALVEEDIKKVVALRTLSQIGFSITTLGLGINLISFIHLIRHALFKSCLFIQVGFIIHNSFNQQDGRLYQNNGNIPIFIQLQIIITLFCLCGLFFRRGSVRKDFILEIFLYNNNNFLFLRIFIISIFLTFSYRWRLIKRVFKSCLLNLKQERSSKIFYFNRIILSVSSLILIWWINLNFFNIRRYFNYLDFYFPLIFLLRFFLIIILFTKRFFSRNNLKFKFLVDFFLKISQKLAKDIKFKDLFINKIRLNVIKNIIKIRYNNLIHLNGSYFNTFLITLILLLIF